MASETHLDPDGVRRLLDNVDGIGADLRTALERVLTIRGTVPAPWGADEYGEKFAEKNEPTAEELLGYVREMLDFIATLGTEGRAAVAEFERLDHENSLGLR